MFHTLHVCQYVKGLLYIRGRWTHMNQFCWGPWWWLVSVLNFVWWKSLHCCPQLAGVWPVCYLNKETLDCSWDLCYTNQTLDAQEPFNVNTDNTALKVLKKVFYKWVCDDDKTVEWSTNGSTDYSIKENIHQGAFLLEQYFVLHNIQLKIKCYLLNRLSTCSFSLNMNAELWLFILRLGFRGSLKGFTGGVGGTSELFSS